MIKHFFLKNDYLFTYMAASVEVVYMGSSTAMHRLLSSCDPQSLSSCDPQVSRPRLPNACGILVTRPGVEPASPALQGGS